MLIIPSSGEERSPTKIMAKDSNDGEKSLINVMTPGSIYSIPAAHSINGLSSGRLRGLQLNHNKQIQKYFSFTMDKLNKNKGE